jgi:hypothetical protein
MSESYTESNAVPEQTLSAMARSTAHVFDSDEQVTEPDSDSEAISPDQLETGKAVADVAARIRALPPFESPDLDAMITDPLLANRPMPPFHVRSSPYDYADKDNGNALMTPDAQAGTLSLVGKAGRTDGSQGDNVRGLCFTGIAVTNESAAAQPFQTVRISPIVSWSASWGLGYVGLPSGGLFGSDPWAEVHGGFDVSAWDDAGNRVSLFGPRELFTLHVSGTGTSWQNTNDADAGLVPDGKVFFSIPPGKTRWVNVDAYIDLKTNYSSFFNQAAAVASLTVEVRYIVLRPADPGRELA